MSKTEICKMNCEVKSKYFSLKENVHILNELLIGRNNRRRKKI